MGQPRPCRVSNRTSIQFLLTNHHLSFAFRLNPRTPRSGLKPLRPDAPSVLDVASCLAITRIRALCLSSSRPAPLPHAPIRYPKRVSPHRIRVRLQVRGFGTAWERPRSGPAGINLGHHMWWQAERMFRVTSPTMTKWASPHGTVMIFMGGLPQMAKYMTCAASQPPIQHYPSPHLSV